MTENSGFQQRYADAWEDLTDRLVHAHAWLQAKAASTSDEENAARLTAKAQVVGDAFDYVGDLNRIIAGDVSAPIGVNAGDYAWAWHEFVRAMIEGYCTETAAAESGRSLVLDYTRGYGADLAAGADAYFAARSRQETTRA